MKANQGFIVVHKGAPSWDTLGPSSGFEVLPPGTHLTFQAYSPHSQFGRKHLVCALDDGRTKIVQQINIEKV